MDLAQINYTTMEKELVEILVEEAGCEAKTNLVDASLHEFELEIKDKKGAEIAVVDHVSRLERGVDLLPIRDEFLDE
ncbi:hypothetical protein CR513_01184, partial [Mucuna pruriens]